MINSNLTQSRPILTQSKPYSTMAIPIMVNLNQILQSTANRKLTRLDQFKPHPKSTHDSHSKLNLMQHGQSKPDWSDSTNSNLI